MIYLIIFIISTIFCLLATYARKKQRKKIAIVLDIVAVFLPAILAGLRNESVGFDIRLYLNDCFFLTQGSSSLLQYINIIQNSYLNIGIGFSCLIYVASKISSDVHMAYFLTNLIPMLFLYLGSKQSYKQSYKSGLIWFLMLLLLYNNSLNIMRQIIAVAIVYFAKNYIYEKKLLKYVICCCIASLFHETAILSILFYFIYWFLKAKATAFRVVIMSVSIVAAIYVYQYVLLKLSEWGLIASRYVMNYSTGFHFGGMNNLFAALIMVFVLAVAVLINAKNNDSLIWFYVVMSFLNCIFFMLGDATSETYRIAYYTTAFIPEMLVYAIGKFKDNGKIFMGTMVVIVTVYFWYTLFIAAGFAATVPYISDFF